LERLSAEDLRGGKTPEENAQIFLRILEGGGTAAQQAVVCANAGMAIHCVQPHITKPDAVQLAKESLHSGKALAAFKAFMS
jgi:anthranilate phosphoribosyltransferase